MNIDMKEDLPMRVAGERVGQHPLPTSTAMLDHCNEAASLTQCKNLIWIVSGISVNEMQTVPMWTGFNMKTRDQIQVSED